jgi:hypothetical protein
MRSGSIRFEFEEESGRMGKYAVVKSAETKESITLVFSGGTVDDIADKTALFMAARGYHLESGTKTQGVYVKGSAAARALVGALAKRAKFNVTVGHDDANVAVVVSKGITGMSGGLLGMSQMGKELGSLSAGLQSAILS